MRLLSILISFSIFCSCNQTENKDFEAHSDCIVYNNEIETESYPFGKVAFIDTTKASGCSKDQLKNVYLLY